MILLGCLLALGLAVAPRLFLVIAWLFADRWPVVWGDAWLAPLLGIIFLPYTTVMYLLAWTPIGISGTLWLWILLGLFLDLTHYVQAAQNCDRVPGLSTSAAAADDESIVEPPAAAPSADAADLRSRSMGPSNA